MKSYFRPAIDAIAGYTPGEQPKIDNLIKLNTNENPYPPSPAVAAALGKLDVGRLRRYPDPTADALRDAIARHWGVKRENVICGNGSDDLLTMIFRAFTSPERPVAVLDPSYSLYPVLAAMQEAPVIRIPLARWNFELEADLAQAAKGANLAMLTRPNAPTGNAIPREKIGKFIFSVIPEHMKERYYIVIGTMKSAVGGYFKAQFKIMVFVYFVIFIGFLVLRIDYAFLIALLIAFLDFLPFFGTGAVMWPWALYLVIQKDYKFALGMMVVWGLSQLVRQLIQPKFVGDSIGMPAIPTLILLYVGFRVGGALGLILAVPIGMIIYNLYKAGLFSNFIYSTKMLLADFRKMRIFTPEELESEGIKDDDLT